MAEDTKSITQAQLDEWRALAEKATPGPWTTERPAGEVHGFARGVLIAATAPSKRNRVYADPPGGSYPAADQDLIAASRTAVPALVAEVERLRTLLRRALPSVEQDAQMMDAMDRHAPLPEADMPAVTAAANDLDALLADIRAALPKEPADG